MSQAKQEDGNEYPGRRATSGCRTVRGCPTEQAAAGAWRAEAPERIVHHSSAMSNESAQLPAQACDPLKFSEKEKAFPHHCLTGLYQ